MARTIAEAIGSMIFNRVLDTLLKPEVPVSDVYAEKVAAQITKEVAPVVENATNSEPWYRSRIYIGLIAAGLGALAQHFGIQVSGADVQLVADSIPELLQAGGTIAEIVGLLYAAYGRWVGSRKKPLGK